LREALIDGRADQAIDCIIYGEPERRGKLPQSHKRRATHHLPECPLLEAKRTCRDRRRGLDRSLMTHLGHESPLLLRRTVPTCYT